MKNKKFVRNSFHSNFLKPLSKNIKQNDFIGFDVETIGDNNDFYSGGLYWIDKNKERFEYFKNKEQMCKFILARKFKNKYIVATNLGFDLTVLFFNTKYWNKFKLLTRNGQIIRASYNLGHNNGTIRFIDTTNYIFWSVEKMGVILNSPKLNKPSFLGERKPSDPAEEVELMNYNRMDCKISHDFINLLQNGVNDIFGNLKLTIASTSLHTFRMNYLKFTLIKESFVLKDDKIKDFIFKAYYGGRTEVFKRGKFNNLYYYDINSLYPYVMCFSYPVPQSVKKVETPSVENIIKYMGVTEAVVYCPKNINKPLLPVRKDKLIFPTGRFKGVWNNCELAKALELGYKIKPIKQIIYTECFQPFKEYIEVLYNKRLEYKTQNSPFELIAKLLMNSLYGKFATKHTEKLRIINLKEWDKSVADLKRLTKNHKFDYKNDNLILREQKDFNGVYSFPILSSYVTSYARLVMYDYINNDNVIYTDTDSIVLTSGDYQDNKDLGMLKLEGIFKTGIFVKPKFYCLDNDIKIKGVNKASQTDFNDILNGKSVTKIKFSKLKESVRRGITPNKKISVTKCLSLEDNKRVWEHQDLSIVSDSIPIELSEV